MKANNPDRNKNLVNFRNGNDTRRNLKGRPHKIPGLDELLAEVMGMEKRKGLTYMKSILMALRAKADRGDVRAAEILLERAYGKVRQDFDHNIKAEVVIGKIEIVKIVRPEPVLSVG